MYPLILFFFFFPASQKQIPCVYQFPQCLKTVTVIRFLPGLIAFLLGWKYKKRGKSIAWIFQAVLYLIINIFKSIVETVTRKYKKHTIKEKLDLLNTCKVFEYCLAAQEIKE